MLVISLTSNSSRLNSEPYEGHDEAKRPAFIIWSLKKRSLRAISPDLLIYIKKVYRMKQTKVISIRSQKEKITSYRYSENDWSLIIEVTDNEHTWVANVLWKGLFPVLSYPHNKNKEKEIIKRKIQTRILTREDFQKTEMYIILVGFDA